MTSRFSIPGMHCEGCARLIKDISHDFPQIQSVNVDLATKIVTVDHAADFDAKAWAAAVEEANEAYKVQAA